MEPTWGSHGHTTPLASARVNLLELQGLIGISTFKASTDITLTPRPLFPSLKSTFRAPPGTSGFSFYWAVSHLAALFQV